MADVETLLENLGLLNCRNTRISIVSAYSLKELYSINFHNSIYATVDVALCNINTFNNLQNVGL